MKKLAFLSSAFVLTVGLTIFSSAMPAKADANAAFCINNPGANAVTGCDYYTLAQCQSASRGIGGSCVANPFAAQARQRSRTTR